MPPRKAKQTKKRATKQTKSAVKTTRREQSAETTRRQTSAKRPTARRAPQDQFINRELSWIEFNARVLREGLRKDLPLLERLNFLSIVTSNFNEFFQVRVASLKRLLQNSPNQKDISGMTARQQLNAISIRAHEVMAEQQQCLNSEILPLLANEGFVYKKPQSFSAQQKAFTEEFFKTQILPLLTPLRTDTDQFPQIVNLKYHVAFLLKPIANIKPMHKAFAAKDDVPLVSLVQIPDTIENLVWLPSELATDDEAIFEFTTIGDLVVQYGTNLFPGFEVLQSLLFNVARDADFAVDEDAGDDFIHAMQEVLEQRQSSFAVRLVCDKTSQTIQKFLASKLKLSSKDVYAFENLIDAATFCEISNSEESARLQNQKWQHFDSNAFPIDEPYWDTLKQRDVILHVPYESYQPVIKLIEDAADDDDVISIKMTLYRTGRSSPIINALKKAAHNGKQVTALVELKARFDEELNIAWAEELERAGVIVVYGLVNLKVHAKILMIIRREQDTFKRYVHLATGNYNPKTARLYSDISLFTSNQDIADDATKFFNIVTGYSSIQTMKYISIAPVDMKSKLLSMIQREIGLSTPETPGLIMAKMNSLADSEVISALYAANRAGVKILLNIRGICMLLPGVKGMSENIKVVSIVDRYLEHARIFYFKNGASPEIYLSSADWMPRNLDRRIELMFPVLSDDTFAEMKSILETYFNSNTNISELHKDAQWKPLSPNGEPPRRAQEILHNRYKSRNERAKSPKGEFTVRRK